MSYKRIGRLAALLLVGSIALSSAHGQTAEDSVKAAVDLLFSGMKASDPAMIRRSFADSAILQTIPTDKNGRSAVRTESLDDFAASIGKLAPGSADERITIDVVRIDGPLAMVWAPYNFYYKGQFSHCGVDSFQLILVNGSWKIQYIVDTRRRQPCRP